jgi:tetratricopeptide (TPR) repeat protein
VDASGALHELVDLRRALHRDPRHVAEVTAHMATEARAAGDAALASQCLALLGRARRSLGEIDLAESALEEALKYAAQTTDADLEADARIGLAGVLSFAGRTEEGLTQLDMAERIASGRPKAYAALQRAIIDQRVGRTAAALIGYESALPTLRQLDATIDIALVLMNRGVIRTQSGDIDGAVADLTESHDLFVAESHAFGVAQTLHGLGWAYARGGELQRALEHLDLAITRFADLGHAASEVVIDRIEVLLAAGLSGEAYETAIETVARLAAAGNHSLVAETWLLCAQAARLAGDRRSAVEHAERARALFAEQQSPGWERAARLEAHRGSGTASVDVLVALADELTMVGNASGATVALALACQRAADEGANTRASALATSCSERAERLGVLEVRLLASHAEAIAALGNGHRNEAQARVRSGLDDLHRCRVALGATDARAAIGAHAADLAALGLRIAVEGGDAADVLEWIERARAGRTLPIPPRPPDDAELAADLVELRAVVSALRTCETDGSDPGDLLSRQRALEASVRQRHLRAGGEQAPAPEPPTPDDLRRRLGDAALVEMAEVGGRLIGVAVDADALRLVELGPATRANDAAASAAASLRSLLTSDSAGQARASRIDRLHAALSAVDEVLRPLLDGDGPLVIVAPPLLQHLPWSIVPSIAGRPATVAPSGAWLARTKAHPSNGSARSVVTVAGPRLVHAADEASRVAGCYDDATTLAGGDASAPQVLAALARSDIIHIAAHGRLRPDNPLWSSLELVDGPLSVFDVERNGRTPPTVVLSACESGVGVRTGDDLLGLASTFLDLGTRSLVATVCPLPDTPVTAATMVALHVRLAAGRSAAVALAENSITEDDTLVAACLVCFGAL